MNHSTRDTIAWFLLMALIAAAGLIIGTGLA